MLTPAAKALGEQPAYPHDEFLDGGMTKREAIAMAAMQGLLANKGIYEDQRQDVRFLALRHADALLNELAKETT